MGSISDSWATTDTPRLSRGVLPAAKEYNGKELLSTSETAAPSPRYHKSMTGPRISEHANSMLEIWRALQHIRSGKRKIILDGTRLDIPSLIAVARYGVKPDISNDEDLAEHLQLSVDALATYLSKDYVVYGVNTGFGGSADTRTDDLIDLQIGVMQHTQSAIITRYDKDPAGNSEREPGHVMPLEWVRGAILARANQNLRGHSAIRMEVLQGLVNLLRHDIVPMVPLRGTISASGDLMPMSYIAGAVMGNPDIFVQVGKGREAKVIPSNEALRQKGISPSGLGPKEALGLVNGTAPSVSVATLVLHDAHQLAYLAQLLTGFASESMGGNVEWAQPFVHAVRPHPGQIEAATNIRRCLMGSQFVDGLESRKRTGEGLWQDRYSTRTAPQWISPYLEDLILAQRQIEVELNSTSDNPLVDAYAKDGKAVGEVYSGGNFQATVITSAMDKTRLALQMIGRMMFSQVSEIISPMTNNGLEANLNASDKENFTMKGIDVNMSAYQSELAALAHPVSAHVMSAEMHNQGINSLALISARRTMEALDIVAHMAACHLYVCCQAVDIRANHQRLLREVESQLRSPNGSLSTLLLPSRSHEKLAEKLMPIIEKTWYQHNTNTWKDRIQPTAEAIISPITDLLVEEGVDCTMSHLTSFKRTFHTSLTETATSIFFPARAVAPAAVAEQLGDGTSLLYTWVRGKLSVPTQLGITDDPLYNLKYGLPTEGKKTIGSWVSIVYESVKGNFMDMMIESLEVARKGPRSSLQYEQVVREMKERY